MPDNLVKKVYNSGVKSPNYSETVTYGDLVLVSGHGVNTGKGVGEQTTKVLDDLETSLKLGGATLASVLKVNVYLTTLDNYAAMNEAFKGRFGPEPPVRTTVAVAGIPLEGALVEIEMVAGKA